MGRHKYKFTDDYIIEWSEPRQAAYAYPANRVKSQIHWFKRLTGWFSMSLSVVSKLKYAKR